MDKVAKSRRTYIILGLFLGLIGAHNLYSGRYVIGILQFLNLAVLGWLGFAFIVNLFWLIFDLAVVDVDGDGRMMV